MKTPMNRPDMQRATLPHAKAGFTLIELMIVIMVVLVLAAITVPAYSKVRTSSLNARYICDLRAAKGAFFQYSMENNGRYPADAQPGIVPEGMQPYLGYFQWTAPTGVGGRWDWDYMQFGCKAGVSVYQPSATVEQMQQMDRVIDDGDLSTGSFRSRSAGYISIME